MKTFLSAIFASSLLYVFFLNIEPSFVAAGSQATSSASLSVINEISINGCSGTEVLSPSFDLSNRVAVATATACTVNSNDPDGYQLVVKSTSTPALVRVGGGDNIDDMATDTPKTWSDAGVNETIFAFSAYGDDVSKYGSYQGTCGSSGATVFNSPTNSLWVGFTETGTSTMDTNSDNGINRTSRLCLVAMRGNSASVVSGSYSAGIIYTATVK